MDDKLYKKMLEESIILKESIPWRNGNVPVEVGSTSIDGLRQGCIVLNELKFFLSLKPSFMIVTPNLPILYRENSATNGFVFAASDAQNLEYTAIQKGKADPKTKMGIRPDHQPGVGQPTIQQ